MSNEVETVRLSNTCAMCKTSLDGLYELMAIPGNVHIRPPLCEYGQS